MNNEYIHGELMDKKLDMMIPFISFFLLLFHFELKKFSVYIHSI